MPLEEVLKEFILELEIKDYSKRTLKGYRNNNLLFIKYLKSNFNIECVEEVKTIHIKSYIKALQKTDKKTTYINGILKCFRAFFKYATQEEIININPMLKVDWVKEGTTLINTFTKDEVYRMMKVYTGSQYIDIRNKLIMALLFDTGIRCSELCNIKNKDITETYMTIVQGKGKKDRRVALSPYVRKLILRYTRCRNSYFANRTIEDDDYFFISYSYKILTVEAVERVVKICGQKAKIRKEIRCSPHTCRHWFAQEQLRNGLDVYSLSRLLGHTNTNITTRYLRSLQDEDIVDTSVKTSPLTNLRK